MLKFLLVLSILSSSVFAQKELTPAESNIMKTEALKLWQKRDIQESLEESLSKFEHAHRANPADVEVLFDLARGYYTLAELHLTNDDLKLKNFEKAREFGEKGLMTNPEYKKLAEDDIEKAIDAVSEKEIPVMFWTAASLGKWSKLNGIMSSLKYKGRILAMIKKVEKMKPDFYYGAVARYWGGFYAVAPSIAGGDMEKSKANFLKAMQAAPAYLGTKTLYAELYLVKKDDKTEFTKQLNEVLVAPNGPEDIIPENMLEKKKAERLLGKADDLF